MTRPKIIDTFMFNDELDMLECRLTEIGDIVDHVVLVEADTTHQDTPKPYHYSENADRFAAWADKITVVHATGLPAKGEDSDPWNRENAQREWIGVGLDAIGVASTDLIFQSDVDEIPRRIAMRNVRPDGMLAFGMRFHPFAVDWRHPEDWRGTVVAPARAIKDLGDRRFSRMRDCRNIAPCPPYLRDAGWHFTWVGGNAYAQRKLHAFCHPEIIGRTQGPLDDDLYYVDGWHVDGTKLHPVDVDGTWPEWITSRRCPSHWFRPR